MISRQENRIAVSGNMTIDSVAALYQAGLPMQRGEKLVVDLSGVALVDSAAVSLLLSWLRGAGQIGVNLCFERVPANLLSLAQLYGIADALPQCAVEDRPVE